MNDTHGETGTGWYGFDLDGTLAKYDGWKGISHIGEPVKPMVDLIKRMHDEGKVVKILTARVAPRPNPETAKTRYPLYVGEDVGDTPIYAARWKEKMRNAGCLDDWLDACNFYTKEMWTARDFVADWCLENLGFVPEITHEKDHLMLELYDDRVKQVIPNTGILVEDELARTRGSVADLIDCNQGISRMEAIGWSLIGCFVGILLVLVMFIIYDSFAPTKADAEAKLIEALREYRESARPNFVRELFTGSEERK